MVHVSIEFLKQVLQEMEDMWERIDGEWGPTPGGLEQSIEEGQEPIIKELRRVIAEAQVPGEQ